MMPGNVNEVRGKRMRLLSPALDAPRAFRHHTPYAPHHIARNSGTCNASLSYRHDHSCMKSGNDAVRGMSDAWTVKFADAKKRLDVFLSEKAAGLSRAQAKKRVEAGGFVVNGKTVAGHYFLKEGDVVSAVGAGQARSDRRTARGVKTAAARQTRATTPSVPFPASDLRIIQETPAWIVVCKPAGVLMHPDSQTLGGTLIDAVIEHAPEVARVGEDPARPGIVSRLDKDVSGLVVIAKTQAAFENLKRQFAEHSVAKEYLALVHGEVPKDEGEMKFRIARSTSKARMAARPEGAEGGQAAWTHYEVVRRFRGATLLKLEILTGRTHQIRAHLHAFGHPVIGDPLYKQRQPDRKLAAPRVLLQSVALAFDDPETGERRSFRIEPDPEFQETIERLTQRK